MKEISRAKKLEVVQYYLLGYSYEEIARKSNVSKGSVVNIIKEVGEGKLAVPGIPFDRVNDLRELSSDLKKKGFEPSQALLGVQYFERLTNLGVAPEDLDQWSELMTTFCPPDLPARDFFEAAFRSVRIFINKAVNIRTIANHTRISPITMAVPMNPNNIRYKLDASLPCKARPGSICGLP